MIRCAICDDETAMLALLESKICQIFTQEQFKCSIDTFSSGERLLKRHQNAPYDILFLDILMSGCDGFEVAKKVQVQSPNTLLIFVTVQDSLVYNSLDFRPFHFIRKSKIFSKNSELTIVTRKLIQYYREHQSVTLDLGVGERRIVSYSEIQYLKSNSHYLEYYLMNGEILRVRQKISEAEAELEGHGFLKIHRQYIVNLHAIERIGKTNAFLRLHSGKVLKIAPSCLDNLLLQYHEQLSFIP